MCVCACIYLRACYFVFLFRVCTDTGVAVGVTDTGVTVVGTAVGAIEPANGAPCVSAYVCVCVCVCASVGVCEFVFVCM